jgi:hypothetical protein
MQPVPLPSSLCPCPAACAHVQKPVPLSSSLCPCPATCAPVQLSCLYFPRIIYLSLFPPLCAPVQYCVFLSSILSLCSALYAPFPALVPLSVSLCHCPAACAPVRQPLPLPSSLCPCPATCAPVQLSCICFPKVIFSILHSNTPCPCTVYNAMCPYPASCTYVVQHSMPFFQFSVPLTVSLYPCLRGRRPRLP